MSFRSRDKSNLVPEQTLPGTPWPVATRGIMSEREKSLYQDLISLYPDHKIFVQVALSQLLDVARDHPDQIAIPGRFKQLVADFVLCRSDLNIVTVIKLDDRTHLRADRKRSATRYGNRLPGTQFEKSRNAPCSRVYKSVKRGRRCLSKPASSACGKFSDMTGSGLHTYAGSSRVTARRPRRAAPSAAPAFAPLCSTSARPSAAERKSSQRV